MENKKFEENMLKENSLEVKQDIKHDLKPHNKSKFFIIIFIFLTILFGLLILLRGLLLANVPYFNNSDIGKALNKILNPNYASELNNVKVDINGNPLPMFGDSIKSPFTPNYSDQKIWLSLNEPDQVKVGYIDINQNFNFKYNLPKDSTLIDLFEDETLSFVKNPDNGNVAQLFIQQQNAIPIQVTALDLGQYFISTYFQPNEKLFYYTSFDIVNTLHLNAVNLNGKVTSIFNSNFLNNKTKVIYIDNKKGTIYLQNNINCYVLTLEDKKLNAFNCQSIKRNNEDKIFWSNSNLTGVYSSTFAGEIYQMSSSDAARKVILTGGIGELFNNFTYHDNYLYFITYQLNQISPNVWSANPKSIDQLNLSNFQRTTITIYLPTDSISKLIPQNISAQSNKLFAILNQNLIQYSSTPIYITPISYPVSYPTSYPMSYSIVTYWNNIGIDNVSQVSVNLLTGNYGIN